MFLSRLNEISGGCRNHVSTIQYINRTQSKGVGGGGGTLLYQLYRYVPPQRVCFLSRFSLKTDIDFDHYGLKSGTIFKGTTTAYKHMENGMFWSEIASGFKEPGGTPPPPPPHTKNSEDRGVLPPIPPPRTCTWREIQFP